MERRSHANEAGWVKVRSRPAHHQKVAKLIVILHKTCVVVHVRDTRETTLLLLLLLLRRQLLRELDVDGVRRWRHLELLLLLRLRLLLLWLLALLLLLLKFLLLLKMLLELVLMIRHLLLLLLLPLRRIVLSTRGAVHRGRRAKLGQAA